MAKGCLDSGKKKGKNGGFTLTELVVVMAIISVITAAAVGGIAAYQRWSVFRKQNEYAQTLFTAAQSGLTQYSISRQDEALKKTVERGFGSGSAGALYADGQWQVSPLRSDYSGSASVITAEMIWQIEGDNAAYKYGNIYYLIGTADDYRRYLAGTADELHTALYDIFDRYLYDKSILGSGVICIEFDPAEGLVYSAFYSDMVQAFSYTAASEKGAVFNLTDRTYETRNTYQVGYYGVDTLSKSTTSSLPKPAISNVTLNNEETLNLTWTLSKEKNALMALTYDVTLYDAETREPLLGIRVNQDQTSESGAYYRLPVVKEEAEDENDELQLISCRVTRYTGDKEVDLGEYLFRGYVSGDDESKDAKITLILDALDLDATEEAYRRLRESLQTDGIAESVVSLSDGEEAPDLGETLSLHRFAPEAYGAEEIYCSVQGYAVNYKLTTTRQSNTESMYFGSRIKDEEEEEKTICSIENARHLNNIRYAELMKSSNTAANVTLFDQKELEPSEYRIMNSFAWGYDEETMTEEELESSILYQRAVYQSGQTAPETSAFPSISYLRESSVLHSAATAEVSDEIAQEGSRAPETERYTIDYLVINEEGNSGCVMANSLDEEGSEESSLTGTALVIENDGAIEDLILDHMTVEGISRVAGFCANNRGTLKNLEVSHGTVSGGQFVGGIFAAQNDPMADPDMVYSGLVNFASVTGEKYVGGIAGQLLADTGSILMEDCRNFGRVEGAKELEILSGRLALDQACYIGGIVGEARDLTEEGDRLILQNCQSWPDYKEELTQELLSDPDGLAAWLEEKTRGVYVGGIAGFCSYVRIIGCNTVRPNEEPAFGNEFGEGYVFGDSYVGGIVGFHQGTVGLAADEEPAEDSLAEQINQAVVIGRQYVGGISGANALLSDDTAEYEGQLPVPDRNPAKAAAAIIGYRNEGTVVALEQYGGGITGFNTGMIADCESRTENETESKTENGTENSLLAAARPGDYIGGIAGYNNGIIGITGEAETDGLLVTGDVTGRDFVGGIVGYNDLEAKISGYEFAQGEIEGRIFVGGIAGLNVSSNLLAGQLPAVSRASVCAEYMAGGIIGGSFLVSEEALEAFFDPGMAAVTVTADGAYAGGLIGYHVMLGSKGREPEALRDEVCELAARMILDEEQANGLSLLCPDAGQENRADRAYELVDSFSFTGLSDSTLTICGGNDDPASETETLPDDGQEPGTVAAQLCAGGVIGACQKDSFLTIRQVENRQTVTAFGAVASEELGDEDFHTYSYAGGIIGKITENMSLIDCSNREDTAVAGKGTVTGGLAEINFGTISGCAANSLGDSSLRAVGGIVGINMQEGILEDCELKGTVVGGSQAGGLVCENYGLIKDCLLSGGTVVVSGSASDSEDGEETSVSEETEEEEARLLPADGAAGGYAAYSGSTGVLRFDSDTELSVTIEGVPAAAGGLIGINSGAVEAAEGCRVSIGTDSRIYGTDYAAGAIAVMEKTSSGITELTSIDNYAEVTAQNGLAAGIVAAVRNREAAGEGSISVRFCSNYGVITGIGGAGGVIGLVQDTDRTLSVVIEACENHGFADSGDSGCAAGILAKAEVGQSLLISECVNTGLLQGDGRSAGIVGAVTAGNTDSVITHCRNYGYFYGDSNAVFSGILGALEEGTIGIRYCYGISGAAYPITGADVETEHSYYIGEWETEHVSFGAAEITNSCSRYKENAAGFGNWQADGADPGALVDGDIGGGSVSYSGTSDTEEGEWIDYLFLLNQRIDLTGLSIFWGRPEGEAEAYSDYVVEYSTLAEPGICNWAPFARVEAGAGRIIGENGEDILSTEEPVTDVMAVRIKLKRQAYDTAVYEVRFRGLINGCEYDSMADQNIIVWENESEPTDMGAFVYPAQKAEQGGAAGEKGILLKSRQSEDGQTFVLLNRWKEAVIQELPADPAAAVYADTTDPGLIAQGAAEDNARYRLYSEDDPYFTELEETILPLEAPADIAITDMGSYYLVTWASAEHATGYEAVLILYDGDGAEIRREAAVETELTSLPVTKSQEGMLPFVSFRIEVRSVRDSVRSEAAVSEMFQAALQLPVPVVHVNYDSETGGDGDLNLDEFYITWDKPEYLEDYREEEYEDAQYTCEVTGILKDGSKERIAREEYTEKNELLLDASEWEYAYIAVTVTREGVRDGKIYGLSAVAEPMPYPLKLRLPQITSLWAVPAVGTEGVIMKNQQLYDITWNTPSVQEQRQAVKSYLLTVQDSLGDTVYTEEIRPAEEGETQTARIDLNSLAPGESVQIAVRAIAKEESETYRDARKGEPLELTLPARPYPPEMSGHLSFGTADPALQEKALSIEEFENTGFLLTMTDMNEAGIGGISGAYEVILQVYDSQGGALLYEIEDTHKAGSVNPEGSVNQQEKALRMDGDLITGSCYITGLSADYAGKWLRVIMRTVSDKGVSVWTDEAISDGVVSEVTKEMWYQLPAVCLDTPEVSVAFEPFIYQVGQDGVLQSEWQTVQQTVFAFDETEYAEAYQITLNRRNTLTDMGTRSDRQDWYLSSSDSVTIRKLREEDGMPVYQIDYASSDPWTKPATSSEGWTADQEKQISHLTPQITVSEDGNEVSYLYVLPYQLQLSDPNASTVDRSIWVTLKLRMTVSKETGEDGQAEYRTHFEVIVPDNDFQQDAIFNQSSAVRDLQSLQIRAIYGETEKSDEVIESLAYRDSGIYDWYRTTVDGQPTVKTDELDGPAKKQEWQYVPISLSSEDTIAYELQPGGEDIYIMNILVKNAQGEILTQETRSVPWMKQSDKRVSVIYLPDMADSAQALVNSSISYSELSENRYDPDQPRFVTVRLRVLDPVTGPGEWSEEIVLQYYQENQWVAAGQGSLPRLSLSDFDRNGLSSSTQEIEVSVSRSKADEDEEQILLSADEQVITWEWLETEAKIRSFEIRLHREGDPSDQETILSIPTLTQGDSLPGQDSPYLLFSDDTAAEWQQEAEEETTEEESTEEETTEEETAEEESTEEETSEEESSEEESGEEPTTEAETDATEATEEPTTEAETAEPETTEEPTTEPETAEPETTEEPTMEPELTEPETTEAPTEAPTEEPEITEAPSAEPETAEPPSAEPVQPESVVPETSPETAEPQTAAEAAAEAAGVSIQSEIQDTEPTAGVMGRVFYLCALAPDEEAVVNYRVKLECMLEVEAFWTEDGTDGYRYTLHIPNITWRDDADSLKEQYGEQMPEKVKTVDQVVITKRTADPLRGTVYADQSATIVFDETAAE